MHESKAWHDGLEHSSYIFHDMGSAWFFCALFFSASYFMWEVARV
jgi:hypothetical protein